MLYFVSSVTEFALASNSVFYFYTWCAILKFAGILVSFSFHHLESTSLGSSTEQTCVYSVCMKHRIDSEFSHALTLVQVIDACSFEEHL